jgi:hypothetical protein
MPTSSIRWLVEIVELDDLDRRLLEDFAAAHPRPAEIPFCDYDVDRGEMLELCTSSSPHENHALITRFISHNRWGMFGDWRHFTAFAGHVAVSARRAGFDHEHDLAFYYLHTAARGRFHERIFPLLAEWASDIPCHGAATSNGNNYSYGKSTRLDTSESTAM